MGYYGINPLEKIISEVWQLLGKRINENNNLSILFYDNIHPFNTYEIWKLLVENNRSFSMEYIRRKTNIPKSSVIANTIGLCKAGLVDTMIDSSELDKTYQIEKDKLLEFGKNIDSWRKFEQYISYKYRKTTDLYVLINYYYGIIKDIYKYLEDYLIKKSENNIKIKELYDIIKQSENNRCDLLDLYVLFDLFAHLGILKKKYRGESLDIRIKINEYGSKIYHELNKELEEITKYYKFITENYYDFIAFQILTAIGKNKGYKIVIYRGRKNRNKQGISKRHLEKLLNFLCKCGLIKKDNTESFMRCYITKNSPLYEVSEKCLKYGNNLVGSIKCLSAYIEYYQKICHHRKDR